MLVKKRKGSVLILGIFAALWMFIVIGILLFDGGIIIAAKMDLYNLADAAASAAVKKGYDETTFMYTGKKQINHAKATDAANDIIEMNQKNNGKKKRWQFQPPVLKFDDAKNTVTVELTTTVPTFFLKLFGIPSIPLKGESMEGLMRKQ